MLDAIIDFLSGLFENDSVDVPEVETDLDVDGDTTNVDEAGDASLGMTSDAIIETGSTVVTGNDEVDALLTQGIDTETSNTTDQPQQKTKYRDLNISFGAALGCNICSCKCYLGGDSADSLCTCGHAKWQHLWG